MPLSSIDEPIKVITFKSLFLYSYYFFFFNYTICLLYFINLVKFTYFIFFASYLFILMGTLWFAFVSFEKLHNDNNTNKKNQREFLNVKLGEF